MFTHSKMPIQMLLLFFLCVLLLSIISSWHALLSFIASNKYYKIYKTRRLRIKYEKFLSSVSLLSQTDSVAEVTSFPPLITVLNCSGTGCSTNSSPWGIITFISLDLAVTISAPTDSALRNI